MKNQINIEEQPIVIGVTSRKKAEINRIEKCINLYVELAHLPQWCNDKAKRLMFACKIKELRQKKLELI